MNEATYNLLYNRAIEVQSVINDWVNNLKATENITDKQLSIEIAFALIHDGYKMKELELQYERDVKRKI